MKHNKLLSHCLFLICLSILILPINLSAANYPISWNPKEIKQSVELGTTNDVSATFISTKNLSKVNIWIVPELQPFVSVSPNYFATIKANTPYTVNIHFAVPSQALTGLYKGTIQLKVGSVTYAQVLKVELNIADAFKTIGSAGGLIEVTNPDSPLYRAKIDVPQGAFKEDVIISISHKDNFPELSNEYIPDGVAMEFNPTGAKFEQFLWISLPVPIPPADDEYLAVAYYNDSLAQWELQPILNYDPLTGMGKFLTEHFSVFIVVKGKQKVPDSVSTGFNINTDSLNYENDVFTYCPDEKDHGICNGIAIYSRWYYLNYGHGLKCRYNEDKAQQISCEVYKKYDTITGWPTKLLSWFAWLGFKEANVFDWNQAAYILQSLKKGQPSILGVWGWNNGIVGHALLVVGWEKTGDFSGDFIVYDVNYNNKEFRIKGTKSEGGWKFEYNMCPENPEYCSNYSVFTPYVDFWLDIESVFNKYPPDNYCLTANLSANPANGDAPLSVDLTADVSGTATGTINYTFYCNRSDDGTNITPDWDAKFDAILDDPFTVNDVCNYTQPGTYTAKVIAERGSTSAEARVNITVSSPGTTVIDQKWEPADAAGCGWSGWNMESFHPIGQEFVPTQSMLSAVDVFLAYMPDNIITLNVREGSLSGTVLATTSLEVSSFSQYGSWCHFDFPSPIEVIPGSTYVLELDTNEGFFFEASECYPYPWQTNPNLGYTAGDLILTVAYEDPPYQNRLVYSDSFFRTYAVVPEN